MFFVIALAASTIVETWSRLLGKRAKDLEGALQAMLAGTSPGEGLAGEALAAFKGTSVYESALDASHSWLVRHKGPSYLSAKSFANAITEMLATGRTVEANLNNVPGLKKRLEPIV